MLEPKTRMDRESLHAAGVAAILSLAAIIACYHISRQRPTIDEAPPFEGEVIRRDSWCPPPSYRERPDPGRSPPKAEAKADEPEPHLFSEQLRQFAQLVKDMRTAQRSYLNGEDRTELARSKQLERMVDQSAGNILEPHSIMDQIEQE